MGIVGTMVDAALGWMVQSILGSFFNEQMRVWTHEVGLAEHVTMLESEMKSVQMVLAAAEGRSIDNKPLSDSLDELKELLYDSEDVMDELDYYRLQKQIEGKGCNTAACINHEGSCVSSHTPSFFQPVNSSVNQIISWAIHGRKRKRQEESAHSIMLPLEIKHDISERINGILNRLRFRSKSVKEVLHLEISRHIMVTNHIQSMARNPRLTTSLMIERKVYGRDAERDTIIELLTKGKSSDLGVLPLVGVGGVGKTTLARFVYHDQRIKDHFDLRMWVCVSDNFNEQKLTREMLEHVCRERQGYGNVISFDVLQMTLLEKIRRKRFLLVLDDMWEDGDRRGWENLLAPLKCDEATGSMILVTTRRTSVARMIGTMSKVEVNGLGEKEFWFLFKEWAFYGNENQESDPTLQSIGEHIAKALKGNPLAARSVGALLNRSVCFEHWREVQYKWKSLLGQDDDILDILKFSYEFLPVHLQCCFSYCSLFPKDHQFTQEKLVHAWISQNFVKCCHTDRLEETGKQYLEVLVDWGFFEQVESHYVMHDLMHDLAEKVSSNECASIDGLASKEILPSVRHLSIITTAYDKEEPCNFPSEKFETTLQNIGSLQKLRSLMFFGRNSIMLFKSSKTLCEESKCLRLLSIYVKPEDFSSTHNFLKPYHLRYLEFIVVPTANLSGVIKTVNTYVPQVLTQFYHLQVLEVDNEGGLVLPIGMNNLINLRHLIAYETVHSALASVGNMTSLQELTFKVQDSGNFNIGQLRSMNELVTLRISQLENVKSKEEAKSARLKEREYLDELLLSWDDNSMSPEPTAEKSRDDVLEGLEPPQNLKHLQLARYGGVTSPSWLGSKVTSLKKLHLENCREWRIVQSLEMLPVLSNLKLISMWNLMEVSIPSFLEELVLVNMPKLEKCVGTYGPDLTSRLRVLMVKDCPQLKEFTLFHNDYFLADQKSRFPSLNKLTIGHCHCLIAWRILPLKEMGSLKELELMDVPVVEELSIPPLEKLVLIQMPSLQSCSGITADPSLQFMSSREIQEEWVSSLRKLTIRDCPSLIVSLPIPPSQISVLSIEGLSALPIMTISNREFTIESKALSELDGRILPFHNLKDITSMSLGNCPNLTCISSEGFSQLIALESLWIDDCPNLFQPHVLSEPNSSSISNTLVLPSLKFLFIRSCGIAGRSLSQLLLHLQSLKELHLCDCPHIKFLSINQATESKATDSLATAAITSAKDEQLLELPCNVLCSLKFVSIRECPDLEFRGDNGGFARCTSLVRLQIIGCPKLVASFVSEASNIGLFPTSLEHLEISHLPENLQSYSPNNGMPCLKMLSISNSPFLKSLHLHSCATLEYLQILECQRLGVLEGLQHLSSLRRLDIRMNPELSAAWDLQGQGGNQVPLLPLSLEEFRIANVRNTNRAYWSSYPSIKKLELQYSPDLTSLQLGYCTALEELEISNCQSLSSIEGFQFITNLRSLKVVYSPSVNSCLQFVSQQQGASVIWSRLEALEIQDATVLSTSLCKHLTSLRSLRFWYPVGNNGEPMVSLTEEQERALQLLTSLRTLAFLQCQKLESLPANLRSLDFLEELSILGCQNIRRLPEMGLPPSLRYLCLNSINPELCMQCRMAETEKLKVEIYVKYLCRFFSF